MGDRYDMREAQSYIRLASAPLPVGSTREANVAKKGGGQQNK